MSDLPTIGFTAIPGSSAADAMARVSGIALDESNIQSSVMEVLLDSGVDRMTASAASEAAGQIASNNPTIRDPNTGEITKQGVDLQNLAQNLVGNTVADPRVAANSAASRVDKLPASLSGQERADQAIAIAGEEAARAGASSSAAEDKTREALAAGMSPRDAALAGAAAAVSIAVADNPSPSGLEIFGYFNAMVQGLVTETYQGKETRHINNGSVWTVDNSFIQTTSGALTINCAHYRATADHDESIADYSVGIYSGGYEMYALLPLTAVGGSASGALLSTSLTWAKLSSIAPLKEIGFGGDFYVTLLTTEVTEDQRANARKKIQQAGIALWKASKKLKFG